MYVSAFSPIFKQDHHAQNQLHTTYQILHLSFLSFIFFTPQTATYVRYFKRMILFYNKLIVPDTVYGDKKENIPS